MNREKDEGKEGVKGNMEGEKERESVLVHYRSVTASI